MTAPEQRLAGRRALVTGGGRGIGEAIARRLAAEGAEVCILSRTLDVAEEVADSIGGTAVQVDVADTDAAREAVLAAGPLDILVNNAGFDDFGWFTETTPDRWRRLIATNLEGTLACCHAALPAMQEAGYGRIINIGSEAGRIGSKGNAVYAATKSALFGLTKSLALENARFGINVNTVVVGPVQTPAVDRAREALEIGEHMIEAMTNATLVKRLGRVEEIAAFVAYLASDDGAFITGESIAVSGGMGINA